MILIRTKVILWNGVPIAQALREGQTVELPGPPGALTEEVRLVEPDWYISVWNCRAALAVEVPLPDGASWRTLVPPFRIPDRIVAAMHRDIYRQGGGITMSGRYEILSPTIRRWTRTPRVERWLAKELRRLGIEFVTEATEAGPMS